MFVSGAIAPTVANGQTAKAPYWPIYPCLTDHLLTKPGRSCPGCDEVVEDPDKEIAHTMSVVTGYSYAEVGGLSATPDTLAQLVANLGLEGSRCLCVMEEIAASFVRATGFLIQSSDGRVAILCYRGTEPYNLGNWMTDADIDSELRTLRVGDQSFSVHPGFYRNTRAIDARLMEGLGLALRGESILSGVVDGESQRRVQPLEALYVTGHSLGGAMATVLGLLLLEDPTRKDLKERLRGVYTYGQPMIGGPDLAAHMRETGSDSNFVRFVYEEDVVPAVPPRDVGHYEHFGRGFHLLAGDTQWPPPDAAVAQANLAEFVAAFADLFTSKVSWLDRAIEFGLKANPFKRSGDLTIRDHLPLRYVRQLADPESLSEFGEYPVLTE